MARYGDNEFTREMGPGQSNKGGGRNRSEAEMEERLIGDG